MSRRRPICAIARDLQIICSHFFRFESKHIVPYSFVFGQIICPALVAPRFFGVTDGTQLGVGSATVSLTQGAQSNIRRTPTARSSSCRRLCRPSPPASRSKPRTVRIAAATAQLLANCGAADMSVMNVFLQEYKVPMENFLEQVLVRIAESRFHHTTPHLHLPFSVVLTEMQKREPAGVRAGMRAEIAPLELQKAVLVRHHTPPLCPER